MQAIFLVQIILNTEHLMLSSFTTILIMITCSTNYMSKNISYYDDIKSRIENYIVVHNKCTEIYRERV